MIIGDEINPASVLVSCAPGSVTVGCFTNDGGGAWHVRGVKLTAAGGVCLRTVNGGIIKFQNVDFGTATFQVYPGANSTIEATGPYSISGGAQAHIAASGWFICIARTTTLTGTPAFNPFAWAIRGGTIEHYGGTFVGAATGPRYSTQLNGVIFTNGRGANYFPGSAAGVTAAWSPYQ
jgi:hypothetical protein